MARHVSSGVLLVGVGVAFLLHAQGIVSDRMAWLALPAAIALSGVLRLALDRTAWSAARMFMRFVLAGLLALIIVQPAGISFATLLPAFLIMLGIGFVLRAMLPSSWGRCGSRDW